MKRFTETNKWTDPWFRRLSGSAKLLWFYLTDNCNAIGLIDLDFAFASNDCAQPIEEKHLAELGDRVQLLQENKVFLPMFIGSQYGELSPKCLPHKSILKLAALHKITKHGHRYKFPNHSSMVSEEITLPEPFSHPQEKTSMEKKGGEGVQGEPSRLHGIPATVGEVIAYGKTLFPVVSEDRCRAFFAHYEGQAQTSPSGELFWITSANAVVTNWKAKLPDWKANNQRKDTPNDEPPKKKWTAEEMVRNAL